MYASHYGCSWLSLHITRNIWVYHNIWHIVARCWSIVSWGVRHDLLPDVSGILHSVQVCWRWWRTLLIAELIKILKWMSESYPIKRLDIVWSESDHFCYTTMSDMQSFYILSRYTIWRHYFSAYVRRISSYPFSNQSFEVCYNFWSHQWDVLHVTLYTKQHFFLMTGSI